MKYRSKNILVYGMGKSGYAAAELLNRLGASVYLYDDDTAALAEAAESLAFSVPINTANFIGFDAVILSPGVPSVMPALLEARLNGTQVLSEIELGYGYCQAAIVAVTGTNGKTTVTMLIDHILREAGINSYAAGNIGTPFCEIAAMLSAADTVVLEASSFQLENIKYFSPDIAVLLNLAPDHFDRYFNLDDYAAAKLRIFEYQSKADFAVLNGDDEEIVKRTAEIAAEKIYFSKSNAGDAYIEDGSIYWRGSHIIHTSELFSSLTHNVENSLASTAACSLLGVQPYAIAKALESFEPPHFRVEYIGRLGGRAVYNDSKGTNIAATLAAAKAMAERTALILGGSDKGEDFRELFMSLPQNVCEVLVTGGNAPEILEAALSVGFKNISYRATLQECVECAARADILNILFSPASASFDRYTSYEERGRDFNALVAALDGFSGVFGG